MEAIDTRLTQYQPQILSIVRIMFGLLILQHGLSKLFGFPAAQPANFQLMSLFGAAAVIEIIGGTLITVGLFTRFAALIISGEMAVAYLFFSNRLGLWPWGAPGGASRAHFIPVINGGNLEAIYCFAFLFLAAFGGGIWSLDAKLRNRT
jgi:putative oxidoreductase